MTRPLRLVERSDEPITWDEARRQASARLKWRACQRESTKAAQAAREARQDTLVFWSCVTLLVIGWAWMAWEMWPR